LLNFPYDFLKKKKKKKLVSFSLAEKVFDFPLWFLYTGNEMSFYSKPEITPFPCMRNLRLPKQQTEEMKRSPPFHIALIKKCERRLSVHPCDKENRNSCAKAYGT